MFISSCPLRVSLFGGSTDNPVFVEKFGYGSVISFACSLKTYITLHEDKLGYNNEGGKYIILKIINLNHLANIVLVIPVIYGLIYLNLKV